MKNAVVAGNPDLREIVNSPIDLKSYSGSLRKTRGRGWKDTVEDPTHRRRVRALNIGFKSAESIIDQNFMSLGGRAVRLGNQQPSEQPPSKTGCPK
jgi:hypothetical protein